MLTTSLAGPCYILSLPSEIVLSILSHLSPIDLARISQTCHFLHEHATADPLWHALIQENVPGVRVASSYPFATYRELFLSHYPHWFLTRYKIWFSDADLPGRMIVVRYDQRRGCIEGYQLVARRRSRAYEWWALDPNVVIPAFDPEVSLHLDSPMLQLDAKPSTEEGEFELLGRFSKTIRLRRGSNDTEPNDDRVREHFLQHGIPMTTGALGSTYSHFFYARRLSDAEIPAEFHVDRWPYGSVWPPPTVPSEHRVNGSYRRWESLCSTNVEPDRPRRMSELCERAFHIRRWPERPAGRITVHFFPASAADEEDHGQGHHNGEGSSAGQSSPQQSVATNPNSASLSSEEGHGDGDEHENGHNHEFQLELPTIPTFHPLAISIPAPTLGHPIHLRRPDTATYATLDPELYTPTPNKPYRGIWVGDYSAHGCEFLLITQPDDDDESVSLVDTEGAESVHEEQEQQREEEKKEEEPRPGAPRRGEKGRLAAIKLTGDANVPRGEYSFLVDDLGESGFVEVAKDPPFEGVRVVKSRGHVASAGFHNREFFFCPWFVKVITAQPVLCGSRVWVVAHAGECMRLTRHRRHVPGDEAVPDLA